MHCKLLAPSVKARDYFFVDGEPRPPSAQDLRERLKAQRLLVLMDQHEDFAAAGERSNFSAQRVVFANCYRELIGVDPSERHELRQCLQHLQNVTVEELLANFRR